MGARGTRHKQGWGRTKLLVEVRGHSRLLQAYPIQGLSRFSYPGIVPQLRGSHQIQPGAAPHTTGLYLPHAQPLEGPPPKVCERECEPGNTTQGAGSPIQRMCVGGGGGRGSQAGSKSPAPCWVPRHHLPPLPPQHRHPRDTPVPHSPEPSGVRDTSCAQYPNTAGGREELLKSCQPLGAPSQHQRSPITLPEKSSLQPKTPSPAPPGNPTY